MRAQGFLIYRIWYGNCLVYVGRTKQPLQSRIRGHLFSKPMHRTVNIEQVTKIEYAELGSEADMNLYEIYFILKLIGLSGNICRRIVSFSISLSSKSSIAFCSAFPA